MGMFSLLACTALAGRTAMRSTGRLDFFEAAHSTSGNGVLRAEGGAEEGAGLRALTPGALPPPGGPSDFQPSDLTRKTPQGEEELSWPALAEEQGDALLLPFAALLLAVGAKVVDGCELSSRSPR